MLLGALYYRSVHREQIALWINAEERSPELKGFLNQIQFQYIVLAGIPESHYHLESSGFSRIPLENTPSGTDRLILSVFYVAISDVYYDSIRTLDIHPQKNPFFRSVTSTIYSLHEDLRGEIDLMRKVRYMLNGLPIITITLTPRRYGSVHRYCWIESLMDFQEGFNIDMKRIGAIAQNTAVIDLVVYTIC